MRGREARNYEEERAGLRPVFDRQVATVLLPGETSSRAGTCARKTNETRIDDYPLKTSPHRRGAGRNHLKQGESI